MIEEEAGATRRGLRGTRRRWVDRIEQDDARQCATRRARDARGVREESGRVRCARRGSRRRAFDARDDAAKTNVGMAGTDDGGQIRADARDGARRGRGRTTMSRIERSRRATLKCRVGGGRTTLNGRGSVVYWCDRDRRLTNNDALARAMELANARRAPLVVAVHAGRDLMGDGVGGARRAVFALEGLKELEGDLRAAGAQTATTTGDDAARGILETCERVDASAVVCDFTPLREGRAARRAVANAVGCPMIEVDRHNVVPGVGDERKARVRREDDSSRRFIEISRNF